EGERAAEPRIPSRDQVGVFRLTEDESEKQAGHANPSKNVDETDRHAALMEVRRNEPVHVKPTDHEDPDGPETERRLVALDLAGHHPEEGDHEVRRGEHESRA